MCSGFGSVGGVGVISFPEVVLCVIVFRVWCASPLVGLFVWVGVGGFFGNYDLSSGPPQATPDLGSVRPLLHLTVSSGIKGFPVYWRTVPCWAQKLPPPPPPPPLPSSCFVRQQ